MNLSETIKGAPAHDAGAPALRVSGIGKSFGDAQVLTNVSFELAPGEVHVLLGENGAGKSTLMNILIGLYAADQGKIEIDGVPAALTSPVAALRHGIGMVHQHFKLVGPMTPRENIHLAANQLPAFSTSALIDEKIQEVMAGVELVVPLDRPVNLLSVAEQQRVEIIKALTLGARILIMDEPTAVLTDGETSKVIALMRSLAARGVAIIFISHKLREVVAVGNRVSALRKGKMVLSNIAVDSVTQEDLTKAVMGADDIPSLTYSRQKPGAVVMRVSDLIMLRQKRAVLQDVSFEVRQGEILGIAGVGGNGQVELAEALIGLNPADCTEFTVDGRDVTTASVMQRRAIGLRYIPADRNNQALAPDATINENVGAGAVRDGLISRLWVTPRALQGFAKPRLADFDVAGVMQGGAGPVRLLSGGNAQKVVLARELDGSAKLIIAHSPTRGLDVSAQHQVQSRLIGAAENGAGVLLISEDLEELMAIADRILVMSRGQLAAGDTAMPSREEIGELMLGHA